MKAIVSAAILLLLSQAACYGAEKVPPPSGTTLPKGHPQLPSPAQVAASQPITGKVLKTMDSGGYTYINLKKKDGKKIWVAIPKSKVAVGKSIALVPGEEFKNFESKTLNRKFDSIIFSLGPAQTGGAKKKQEQMMATPGSKGAMVAPEKMTVVRAEGPNNYTVAEIFAQKGKLDGKKVVVRGKVVKVAPRIMKMNWLHLQDGTGSAGMKNHDLVVKTKALPVTGETVTVSGILLKDKDYGMGYKYDVLIDEAEISR